MLDIRFVRSDPEGLDAMLLKRGEKALSRTLLEKDEASREVMQRIEKLREARNAHAKKIARATPGERQALIEAGGKLREDIEALESQNKHLKEGLEQALLQLPNWLAEDVPEGQNETQNKQVKSWGEKPAFDFTPQTHDALGPKHGLDAEKGVALSGARFVLLKGQLARVERAISAFMLDMHTQKFGYEEISPPYLVSEKALYNSGQLPKFREDAFQTTDGRWLISTSEISLVNMAAGEVLSEADLPLKHTAYTPCFRAEAGSAGRDTKGLIRLHQFSKVELVAFASAQQSAAMHEEMLSHAEAVLQALGLHYRVMLLCSGDTGFTASKTYDIEVWMPGQGAYREISSCSNCLDFQARRMKSFYQKADGSRALLHTLNGSGLAVGRTLAALMENYQTEEGQILWPAALERYMV